MDPATYARLTDINRYIASEFEPEPATAGQEAGIELRRRPAFRALRAIFGLERKGPMEASRRHEPKRGGWTLARFRWIRNVLSSAKRATWKP